MSVIAASAEDPISTVAGMIADLPPGAPVTVMLHGYRYSPHSPAKDANASIYALMPGRQGARLLSWPRRLRLGDGRPGIGFGWQADGTIWAAYARALQAGAALAALVAALRERGAGPVGLFGHSLGARVALQALPHLAAGDVGRIVLLSAAEFHGEARAALASPAGRAAQVLNVTSRENDLYDKLLEVLVGGGDRALGVGLDAPNAVTVQIDDPRHRAGLRALGFPTSAPARRICHWSAYMRPGLFPLYRAFLHRPEELGLDALRAALPEETAPRWTRLLALPWTLSEA